jgi:hypothetical protein
MIIGNGVFKAALKFAKYLILVGIGFCLTPAVHAASHDYRPCKPIGRECVGIVVLDDGDFWITNRVMRGEVETWEPIKKADCPNINSYHPRNVYRFDSKYGDYVCKYEWANEAPPPALHMGGFGRYISSHKVLLLNDAGLILAALADSASSVHCQHMHPACVETAAILGRHPSNVSLYGSKMGLTVAWIGINHWWASDHQDEPSQNLYTFWNVPLAFLSTVDAIHNANLSTRLGNAQAAGRMANARTHLLNEIPVR